MPFRESGSIRFFLHELFPETKIVHAVFTRHGGVSPHPWKSLNVGSLVGDDPERVRENQLRAFQGVNRDPKSIYDVWQVHGARVVCIDSPRHADELRIKADAILTNNPRVTLFMRFADCVPLMYYDPRQEVVGLAHAGWQGSVKRVARAVINAMVENYQCRPEDILAAIGPSIGPDHYIVGEDVIDQVVAAFGEQAHSLLISKNGRVLLNLWETNRLTLEEAGVRHIEVAGICSACHLQDWYSHRGEGGRTGRFGALIALRD